MEGEPLPEQKRTTVYLDKALHDWARAHRLNLSRILRLAVRAAQRREEAKR